MDLNIPEIVAEVRAAFEGFERAMESNNTNAMDQMFWNSPHTVRYGLGENLYGIKAIRSYRRGRPSMDLDRELGRTEITTFGEDYATASTLYRRRKSGKTGRQMQTWIRTQDGWRIAASHVSFLDFPWQG